MGELDFSGRKVLIVGGSSGIGNGISHGFRDHGADVHIWGTRPTAADYAGVEGSDITGFGYSNVDVGDPDQIEAAAEPFSTLDVLVLCQGTVAYNREEFERSGWDRVMSVNLDSLMHCCRKFKPMLHASQGVVVIVSSVSGFGANIGNPAYAASKSGAVSLTKSLGMAWAADGIRVNGLAPGFVETKLTAVMSEHPKRRAAMVGAIPLGRPGEPSDMAGPVLFLASPLAKYMVGQTLVVDGGLTL